MRDRRKLFDSGLEGKLRRAIDIREGERLEAESFMALVRSAVAANHSLAGGKSR